MSINIERRQPRDHDHRGIRGVSPMRRSTDAILVGVGHGDILLVNTVEGSDEGAAIVGGDVQQLVEKCSELGA